jgi:threonyl-tRNA synthetase
MSTVEIELELPDGSRMRVPEGTTSLEVAERIGPGLARQAVAGQLDGAWVDLRAPLRRGGALRLITTRDPEAGQVIRHSAEHVMADAVKRLWPETQIDVGRTDHSEKFQYDFDIPVRITPQDLEVIEAEMRRIVEQGESFVREVVSADEARRLFESRGEPLKVSRLGDIPAGEEITLFRHGSFVDLCRGPHVQNTAQIGAFKLTELAGSYWRADEGNQMLQRISGVAFASKKELAAYHKRIEEARRRDHRRVGAELELFQFHEWSPGSAFYLPKGLALHQRLVDYVRGLYRKYGYQEVMCPQIFSTELFKVSGHYELFKDDMFIMRGDEQEEMALKPMNCPGHALIFRSRKRSYRELPMRLAEFTQLHRNERSGTLLGLTRVRSFSQDDAHIFCEPDQVQSETDRFFEMTREIYRDLGLSGLEVYVSTRGSEFIGEPEDWEQAERALFESVERAGFDHRHKPGEAAFYAPKVEFDFHDALGRAWTLGTIQIDMAMPGRFGLRYIGADGQEHEPAMLHRAILGSLERFIAIYLEHTAGDLPLWLAPQQVNVLPVTEHHEEFGRKVLDVLQGAGVRAELDNRNETLGYRVRAAETQKIPYILVVGDREQSDSTVSVRRRHRKGQQTVGVDEFRRQIEEEIMTRGIS